MQKIAYFEQIPQDKARLGMSWNWNQLNHAAIIAAIIAAMFAHCFICFTYRGHCADLFALRPFRMRMLSITLPRPHPAAQLPLGPAVEEVRHRCRCLVPQRQSHRMPCECFCGTKQRMFVESKPTKHKNSKTIQNRREKEKSVQDQGTTLRQSVLRNRAV